MPTRSNRIGGPYTEQEMDLHRELFITGGKKKLVSTHTHTETGDVTVFHHDPKGNVIARDHFRIEHFQLKKQQITRLLGAP